MTNINIPVTDVTADTKVFTVGGWSITIHPAVGHVSVTSSDWSMHGDHCWNARGGVSIWKFLIGIRDRGYIEGKLFEHEKVWLFDLDATKEAIRKEIHSLIENRSLDEDDGLEIEEFLENELYGDTDLTLVPHISACQLRREKRTAASDDFWNSWTALMAKIKDMMDCGTIA